MSKKTLALSHIDNYINGGKNTILLLENKFFYIFKVQIENVLNEEDRKEKLEDRLEIVFPRYNSDDFVLRYEIYKKEKKRENIVVYLMDINYLNDCIIDDMKDYGFISIIPSFFISREKKDLNHYFNFDISENMLVITEYMNNNILDIQSFKLSKSSLDNEDFEVEDKFSIINTFLANITEDIHIIFTGNKINFDDLELENKTYSFYSVDNLDFSKYPNFLPEELRNKYSLYYIEDKYLYILLGLSIITIILTIIIHYSLNSSEKKLEALELESTKLEEEIENARNEMEEIEVESKNLQEFLVKKEDMDIKISSFLEELTYLCPEYLKISSIEYDENKIFNIEGKTDKVERITKFLENITNSKNFILSNYDYILKKSNEIEFKIEVKYRAVPR
ncbi:PilN domain-containing protein [Fusobacterium pseudoperiodonticum]|uniref:Fimbrial assembly protein n=1 Tax=Fusobacterium pseudoperiodonticum TaxID=2663009 RepID=A0AAD0AJQ5_9FUSO|nr:fimbrial assembly protein [Fusobacterium pseudoperiodonticum]ATV36417.1 fimbrial assembly protein [Fusobacterium pseudoperiodonticum]ATV60678.1 fimbrial assembly protein [Fusobacterium pseudoperiodonticum]